jgi:DNA replication and repair protein RecF
VNWRNLQPLQLELGSRLFVLCGSNGHGKTNLLEAIYYLGALRSFRTRNAEEMVRFGEREAKLRAKVERDEIERTLEVTLQPPRRTASIDGKTARSAAEYCGSLSAVVFAPEDLGLPKGSPAARRRFLDRTVFEARPQYLREAQDYQRLLRHRNALLRGMRAGVAKNTAGATLAVYDEKLASAGAVVIEQRRRVLCGIREHYRSSFERIARTGVEVELRYDCPAEVEEARGEEQLTAALSRLIDARRERDLRNGFTSVGPHADDLTMVLSGRSAKLYASQGEVRALVLALKTAEILFVSEMTRDTPVLLLDDVSSELDPERNKHLFEFIDTINCQTFVTTTDRKHLALSREHVLFQVVMGSIAVDS